MASFADLINQANEELQGYQSQLEKAKGDQAEIARITEEMFKVLNKLLDDFAKASKKGTDILKQGLEDSAKAATKTATSVKGVTQSLDQMGTQGKVDTQKLEDGMDNASRSVKETQSQVKKLSDMLGGLPGKAMDFASALSKGNIGGALGVISPTLGRIAGAMQEVYDRSRRLNKEVLEFAGATMPMGKAAASADSYRMKINNLATSMGLTLEEAHQYAKTMQETGFSLDQVTKNVDVAGKSMTTMKAVQAAGISIGASYAETTQMMAESQLYLGQTSAKAIEGIVNIGVAARNAGVSAKILMPIIKNLQGEFRYLGMDTIATTNLITKMGGNSKTAAADVGLMGKALGGMLQMQAGSKAFFGMTGGMPGAQGKGAIGSSLAFEAALAGKGGGTPQDAMKAVSQSLKQMTGGGIVSQTQAYDKNTSETMKTQFYMQRELISKQMGLSTQEAGRMLELMSKAEKGTASKKEQEDLRKTMAGLGKDQTNYVQKTYESSKRLETAIANQTQKLAGMLGNIFGSVGKIAMAVAVAGGLGIAGNVLGGGKKIIDGLAKTFGREGRSAATTVAEGSNVINKTQFMEDVFGGGTKAAAKGLGAVGKKIPILGGVISAGAEGIEAYQEGASKKQIAVRAAGAGVGAAAGTAIGGAIGSFIPIPVIGTAIGMALGGWAGEKIGSKIGQFVAGKMDKKTGSEESDDEKNLKATIAEREKEKKAMQDNGTALKENKERYGEISDELKELRKSLQEASLATAVATKGADIAGKTGGAEGLIAKLKKSGSSALLDTSSVKDYLRGDKSAMGELSEKDMGIIKSYVEGFGKKDEAGTRPAKQQKDVKEVYKKGMTYLSPGDMVVDKDSIANIMGGEKGSAIPKILGKTEMSNTGAGTAMDNFAAASAAAAAGAGKTIGTAGAAQKGQAGGNNELTIRIKGEGILEKLIDERVVVNVKNGTIVGTQKTKAQANY